MNGRVCAVEGGEEPEQEEGGEELKQEEEEEEEWTGIVWSIRFSTKRP